MENLLRDYALIYGLIVKCEEKGMANLRNGKIDKIMYKICIMCLRAEKIFNEKKYRVDYRKLLKRYGMDISVDNCYIDPSAYFDNYDYSIIHIGHNVTISREVLLLTHDFSMNKGLYALNIQRKGRGCPKFQNSNLRAEKKANNMELCESNVDLMSDYAVDLKQKVGTDDQDKMVLGHYGGYFLKGITIEDNCFIGARVIVLPGTVIGKNSIIGSGAVVKGKIPENSILVGNPAKRIADTIEWAESHIEKRDYVEYSIDS